MMNYSILFLFAIIGLIFFLPEQNKSVETSCQWHQLEFQKVPIYINDTNITVAQVQFLIADNLFRSGYGKYIYDVNITNSVQIASNEFLLYGNALICS